MLKYLLQGFMLGLAYVAPIGMQNLYVINTAISKSRSRAYQVALITTFFDISLALACFFGIGTIMEKSPVLKLIILLAGSIVVIIIGVKLILSKDFNTDKVNVDKSILEIIVTCFMVTWINPQAVIDGSLLLGGFRISLPHEGSRLFILGVCMASFLWFTGITTLISSFKNVFSIKIVKIINIICGIIITYYGIRLGISFIQAVTI